MRAHVTVLALHKGGSVPGEYEDAVWIGNGAGRGILPPAGPMCRSGAVGDTDALRVALADGAPESQIARRWAELLVRACGAAPVSALRTGEGLAGVLAHASQYWPEVKKCYREQRDRDRRPVEPWEIAVLERGAHATVLGAHFAAHPRNADGGWWTATGLGGGRLFQIRDGHLRRGHPGGDGTSRAEHLAASNGDLAEVVVERAWVAEGEWEAGDEFLFMTSTTGCWFLDAVAAGGRPWTAFHALAGAEQEELARWAAGQRARGGLENDDLTIVRVLPGA